MRRRSLVVGAAVLFGLVAPACGEEPGRADPSTTAHPASAFTVGWVPDGFLGPQLDVGITPAAISDDSGESVEPFLVLAPDGWDGDVDGLAYVTLIDGSGAEGGIEQSLPDYTHSEPSELVQGREVWRYPDGVAAASSVRAASPQVVADVRGQLAVRAHGPAVPADVLDQLAARTDIRADGRTLELTAAPPGWHVVSGLDPEQTAVLRDPEVGGWVGATPTPVAANGPRRAIWTRGTDWLRVMTVQGSPDDLTGAAVAHLSTGWIARSGRWQIERHGDEWHAERPAAATPPDATPYPAVGAAREVTARGPGGELLLVSATGSDLDALPPFDELERVVASVRADPDGWESTIVAGATRPPEVPAGWVEVAHGQVDGTDWLLAAPPNPAPTGLGYAQTEEALRITGSRALTSSGGGGGQGTFISQLDRVDRPPGSTPPFTATLVSVGEDVMAVSLGSTSDRVPTMPAPGGRVAVIIPASSTNGPLVRYDASGNVLP